MGFRISAMLTVLLGVTGPLLGAASAQEDAEDWGTDTSNITDTLECTLEYEAKVGSCTVERICACDQLCARFGDCCRGSYRDQVTAGGDVTPPQSTPGNDSTTTTTTSEPAYRVCVGLPPSLTRPELYRVVFKDDREYAVPEGYLMVGRCPPSWRDAGVRRLCEAPADESDLLLLLPVVSSDDPASSFRNVYCAVCHGVSLATLTSWRIESAAAANASDLRASGALGAGSVRFTRREGEPRRCIPGAVAGCPAGFADGAGRGVARACASYMAAVVHPVTHVAYRNWHCALCHGALHPSLCDMRRFNIVPQQLDSPASLVALVDFGGNRLELESTGGSVDAACGEGAFLDPFTLRCRAVLCPTGFARDAGGACVGRAPTADATGVVQSECVPAGYVDVQIDTCLDGHSPSDLCGAWRECLRAATAPAAPGERCGTRELVSGERSCARRQRVRLVVNATVPDDVLSEDTERARRRCPLMASVTRLVWTRGCAPPSSVDCAVYRIGDASGVHATSWNGSEALYLRDFDRHVSLRDSLYRATYAYAAARHDDSRPNVTREVIACGEPVQFGCALARVDAGTLSRLLNDSGGAPPLTDANHALLEAGGALVCRHLAVPPTAPLPPALGALGVVTTAAFLVSMLALAASFATYAAFPALRNLPGRCVMSLIAAVFWTQLLLLATGDGTARSVGEPACAALAALLHLACLSSFGWTNALALYLSRALGPGAKPAAAAAGRRTFRYFGLFAWGGPLLVVSACVAAHLGSARTVYGVSEAGRGGARSCSITDTAAEIAAFVVPVAASLLANAVLFVRILAGFAFRRAPSADLCSAEGRSRRKRRDALISVKIGFLLAFSWIFGFLATAFQSVVLLYVFCIMTSLQGVYIFAAFTFTQQVRALWREKLGSRMRRRDPEKPAAQTTRRKCAEGTSPRDAASPAAECRQHSPSEDPTADTAQIGSAKDANAV